MRKNSQDSHSLSAPSAHAQAPRPTDARRPFRRETRGSNSADAEPSDAGLALERQLLLVQTADPLPSRPFATKRGLAIVLSVAFLGIVGAGIYAAVVWEQGRQARLLALVDRLGQLEVASRQQSADLVAGQEAITQELQASVSDNTSLKASLARSDARLATQSRALDSLRKETASSLTAYRSLQAEQKAALETAKELWRSAARVFSSAFARPDALSRPQ